MPGVSAYAASKAALRSIVPSLAAELGPQGIRVNAINPSITRSEMVDAITGSDEMMQAFKQRVALGRIGEPEDIAGVAAFLASEDAGFVTGVNLPVDGGVSASNGQPNYLALMG